jgi:uncharacterized protein
VENFTPVSALIGGTLIGLGAAVLLLASGRIAGISGIIGGMLTPAAGDFVWRLCFVVGLIAGAGAFAAAAPDRFMVELDAPTVSIVAAGLLVGYGTRLGSGCTSGHGVCGIGRLSPRSITATLLFMVSAILTVYLVRHAIAG